jgi:hypothetical protein
MDGIAKRIKAGQNIKRDGRIAEPDVGHRNGEIFGKSALSIDSDSLVPYSRKPAIKNKKSGEYFKIRIIK